MASTSLTTNNNDVSRHLLTQPTGTYADDITEPAGCNRIRKDAAEQELYVKWQMPGSPDQANAKKQLHQLLVTLLLTFPNQVTLIDTKKQEWEYHESDDSEKFEKSFGKVSLQIHPVKNKQQKIVRWVSITKLRTITEIKDWKNNDQFYSTVIEAKTHLFPHPFQADEWDIASIGFLKGVHAIHYPKEEMHKQICQLITDDNRSLQPPKFQLIPQRVTSTDKQASTKAYTVQCPKSEANRLSHLLTHGAFRNAPNQMFVPFKYKSTKRDVFLQCIRQQNDVYYKTWIVKVEGLSKEAMEVIKPDILSLKGVYHVVPTKRTKAIGEWKIMVDQAKCAFIHRTLTTIWPTMVAKISQDILEASPAWYSTPAISSKKVREYQDSESDVDSYGSLLTTGTEVSQMTLEDTSLNELPPSYQLPTYAAAVMASNTSIDNTQISSPTVSTHNEWKKDKQELEAQIQSQAAQIEKIKADLQAKISRSQDLEEQLAQAIDLAHSRDARHEEMMEKFEMLMQQQVHQLSNTNYSPARHHQAPESPPSKKANTNASPARNLYAVFRSSTGRNITGNISRSPSTSSLTNMETDDDHPPPPPGVKSGQKLE